MAAGSKYENLVERWGGEPGVHNPFDVFKEVGADLVALGGDPAEVVTRLREQMARASEVMFRSLVPILITPNIRVSIAEMQVISCF